MELSERIEFLKRTTIFAETPAAVLSMVASKLKELDVEAGKAVVLKVEQGTCMYFITRGRVLVHDGDHEFARLTAGGFFGKYYLIDQKERSASVTALQSCHLLSLDHELFRAVTRDENSVLTGILKSLVSRLRDMNIAEEELVKQKEEIEKQKAELEQQRLQLVELNATKDKFFSIIAHDLRSPISTLISLSDLLRTELESLTPLQTTEVLSSLHDLSKNYLRLLDNLLQWSNMQTGRLQANPVLFDISQLLPEVAAIYKAMAADKGISLVTVQADPCFVFADKDMIRTILRNLISNALKYTSHGGEVKVDVNPAPDVVLVTVSDNGVGMSSDIVDKLFRIDLALSTKGTANERGTGLGLILCNEFVKKNNGSLSVESQPGIGSRFAFSLPASEII